MTKKVPIRRDAREFAVQMLFEQALNPKPEKDLFHEFWSKKEVDQKSKLFAENTVSGVLQNRRKIDETIAKYSENWNIRRIGGVEKSVMRIAVYEMLFCDDIPPVVSINEAVDISKYFSNKESGRFVNGILDKVKQGIDRPARTPKRN
ncbi:MAG: transcription antitermination factor NusB [Kiritimatiellae bacterium]|nr:transcription antitermination factor NusB [Kiritimatiellia bacterium]